MRSANLVRSERRGFTILELLVVIAIITVLVGLTAAAVFRVQAGQSIRRTESVLAKLHSALDQQWKVTLDDARKTAVSRPVMTMADNDSRRAAALWNKFFLRREFPVSFAEIVDTNSYYPTYLYMAGKQEWNDLVFPLQVSQLQWNIPPDTQSAICLYFALSQSRQGMGFNADETLGPSIRTLTFTNPNNTAQSANFKVFVDSWGTPIKFIRWPDPTQHKALLTEMNLPEFSPANLKWRDREDTEGLLLPQTPPAPPIGDATDANSNNLWSATNQNAAQLRLHIFLNKNFMPTAISAGSDKKFDTARYQFDTGDDIFSFRSRRERQRGE
jgi:prepilin-type N-terminal cleavage/methylation domain-containing protein